MNIKKKFGLTHLVTGYKYIDSLEGEHNTSEDYYKSLHYMQWLHETKLTAAMFQEGGLFEGFQKGDSQDSIVQYCFFILDKMTISFFRPYTLNGKITVKIKVVIYREEHDGHLEASNDIFIQTLADLARLTAKHPLKLR